MEDRDITDAREGPKLDLRKLIEFILRKFFKAVQDHPFLLLEVRPPFPPTASLLAVEYFHDQLLMLGRCAQCFYPKTKTQLGKMRLGEADPYGDSDDDSLIYKVRRLFRSPFNALSSLESGADVLVPLSRTQAKKIGEVEVAPGFSHTQQIGIAIACLVEAGDDKLIDLIKSVRRSLAVLYRCCRARALMPLGPPAATRPRLGRPHRGRPHGRRPSRRRLSRRRGDGRGHAREGGAAQGSVVRGRCALRPARGRPRRRRGRQGGGDGQRTLQAPHAPLELGEQRRCVPLSVAVVL